MEGMNKVKRKSKRGRKPLPDKDKKSSKLRAKEHRERKKVYYDGLEEEVKQLREKVIDLEAQLQLLGGDSVWNRPTQSDTTSFINIKAGTFKCESIEENKSEIFEKKSIPSTIGAEIDELLRKLKEEQDFVTNILPKLLRDNPEKVKFTMLDQNRENLSSFSPLRVALIKKAFRIILENIAPLDTKLTIMYQKHLSHTEWQERVKRLNDGSFSTIPNFKNPAKVFNDVFLELEKSEHLVKTWALVAKDYRVIIDELRANISNLVTARNGILKGLKKIQVFEDGSDIYMGMEKKHHLTVIEKCSKFKDHPQLNIFELYNIKRKPEFKEIGDVGELSE